LPIAGLLMESFTVGEAQSSARFYRAAQSRGCALVLAHGAGAPQTHPFMVGFAEAIAARGIDVVTFDFLYMHAHKKAPDRNDKLEACWRAAIGLARARLEPERLFIGGKSMGGRIASQIAAVDHQVIGQGIAGLVLLGYPLHPPGQPEKLRVAHLANIAVPILCVQGERDEFGSPDDVRAYLPPSAEVMAVAGRHSFNPRDYPDIQARVAKFILQTRE
jgi:predicted alpha/beta-hydrolase family hydrolase